MSKWATWIDSETGLKHVIPTRVTPAGEFVEEPHIVDEDCECGTRRDEERKDLVIHSGEDDRPVIH